MNNFCVYESNVGLAGMCYFTHKKSVTSSVFSYDSAYLSAKNSYNIDPEIELIVGSQPVARPLLGAFADSAPDRWGRNLIYQRHLQFAQANGEVASTLSEVDYLLGVSDMARMGSLQFSNAMGSIFLHADNDIPKLLDLPKLLNSTLALESKGADESFAAVKYLLCVGSASLGGARPKAIVRDEGKLYLAKFPHATDKWNVMAWEYVALQLAKSANINVPNYKLLEVDKQNVLLTERFDRGYDNTANEPNRIGYFSAMTLLNASDSERYDYRDICAKMSYISLNYADDLAELYRRIVLSVLINNTDDHLRNHGFLRRANAWQLSPVFDINPNPSLAEARVTSILGQLKRADAIAALKQSCSLFMLTAQQANDILLEVQLACSKWRKIARDVGIAKSEIATMQDALNFYSSV